MNIKTLLDQYLAKDSRISERRIDDQHSEVCDLDTGQCYTVRLRDGLIERVEDSRRINRTLRVETPQGVKTLLND